MTEGLPGGLLGMATALVAIPSVSHYEAPLADAVEAALGLCPWLDVERVGDNVVARTGLGRSQRVLIGGHLDTVPPSGGNEEPRLVEDTLYGVGSCDMKGGLAVLLHLAGLMAEPAVDVTWCFYVCEEVDQRFNGLRALWDHRPELLEADAAVLAEPTGGVVAGYEGRRPVLDGCEYAEQLQVVDVAGGVAANVVPDRASVLINHRFAPDRSADEAEAALHRMLGADLEPGDRWELVDVAAGAPPALGHPLLSRLVGATGAPARAKQGWTDVASFWAHGIPAANFGPGDPLLAHTRDEHVSSAELEDAAAVLAQLLEGAG